MTQTPNIQPSDIKPPRIKPPHRNRRLAWVALIGVLLAAGMTLLFSALGENTQFFYNPSDVVKTGFQPASNPFRIGGRVVEGSVEQGPGLLTKFSVTDFEREMSAPIEVRYQGVLPDLFREGQGVIISGELTSRFNFIGQEVLAKHDENYQPKIDYQDENKS